MTKGARLAKWPILRFLQKIAALTSSETKDFRTLLASIQFVSDVTSRARRIFHIKRKKMIYNPKKIFSQKFDKSVFPGSLFESVSLSQENKIWSKNKARLGQN